MRCKHTGHRAGAHRGVIFFDDGWSDNDIVTSLPDINNVGYHQARPNDKHVPAMKDIDSYPPRYAPRGDAPEPSAAQEREPRVNLLEARQTANARSFSRHTDNADVIEETTHGSYVKYAFFQGSTCTYMY